MDTIHETPHTHHTTADLRHGIPTEYGTYCWQCISSFGLSILGLFMMGVVYPFMSASTFVLVMSTLCFLLSIVLGVMGYATVRDRGQRGRVFGFAGAVLSTLLIIAMLGNYAMYSGMVNRPFYNLSVTERTVDPL